MHPLLSLLTLFAAAATSFAADAPAILGREVPDFALLDHRGKQYQLSRSDTRAVVLFFTANGCPIARQNLRAIRQLQNAAIEQNVRFWYVNSSAADDRESIEREIHEFGYGWMPVLMDENQGLAAALSARRTGTAILIDTKSRKVLYHGAVDDRLVEGAQKPKATKNYLKDALTAFLESKPIELASTETHGCLISIAPKTVDYSKDVAPILAQKCFGCHSTGNIGPIKFANHQKVSGNADMIQEVLLARRMPPWHADRHHGSFANDSSLSLDEQRTLLRWIEQGAPRGEGADPLETAVPPSDAWILGEPDAILQLPKVEKIPANGILPYRHIKVSVPFEKDAWVKGVTVKPDNRRVVHHLIVRVQEPGQGNPNAGNEDDAFLMGWAPGTPEIFFPEGTGKLIKKGSVLDFEMHYTTSGREEEDQSRIGLYLHKEQPSLVLKTRAAYNLHFEVGPNTHENVAATYAVKTESMLYDLSPHMHMRGKWFKYEALLPTGEKELLLSVPEYDFKWQHTYRLRTPKRLPAGTWILCTGGFDNSEKKPGNPNPRIPLHFGEQSFDEMFIGFMGIAELPTTATKPLAGK